MSSAALGGLWYNGAKGGDMGPKGDSMLAGVISFAFVMTFGIGFVCGVLWNMHEVMTR